MDIHILIFMFFLFIDPVPPNATLIFEVELYSVSRGPRSMESFREIDVDNDRTLTKAEVPYNIFNH